MGSEKHCLPASDTVFNYCHRVLLLLECHIRAAASNAKSSSSFSFEDHIDKVKLITLNRLGTKDTEFPKVMTL